MSGIEVLALALLMFGWIAEPVVGFVRAMHPEWSRSLLPAYIQLAAFWWVLLICPAAAAGLAGWHWRARGLLAAFVYPACGFLGLQLILLAVTRLPVTFPPCPPGVICEGPWTIAWLALIPSPLVAILSAGIGWWLRKRQSHEVASPAD